MCNEYNVPLHLAFVDLNKAFDSVEMWGILAAKDNVRNFKIKMEMGRAYG